MSAQERLNAALEALVAGEIDRAYVLASEVQAARYYDPRRTPDWATAQQAADALQIKCWAIRARFAQG